eukprot:scaffold39438_cov42-Attheya_sp.AAC.1
MPAIQNEGRGRGGVGIFLSPQARKAWEKAGCPNPITSGVICKAARFIGLQLTLTDHLGKEIKAAVCSVYHPTKVADWEYAEFLTKLAQFYDKLDDDNTIIISGNDTNSSIGTRLNDYCELDGVADEQSDRHILGPHGIQYVNDRGNDVRQLLRMQNLAVATSFFQNDADRFITRTSNLPPIDERNQQPRRLHFNPDHFLSQNNIENP